MVEVIKTYEVTARRWAQGWELHVADVGVTQCQPLADADRMARDYLATELGGEPEDYEVDIRPDLGGIEVEAAAVRQRMLEAQAAVDRAADDMRRVVRQLRGDGLSVRDTATILEVSPGPNDHPKTRKAVPRVKVRRQVA